MLGGALPGSPGLRRLARDQPSYGLLAHTNLRDCGLVAVVARHYVHELVGEHATPLGGREPIVQSDPPSAFRRTCHAVGQAHDGCAQPRVVVDGLRGVERLSGHDLNGCMRINSARARCRESAVAQIQDRSKAKDPAHDGEPGPSGAMRHHD